MNYNDRLGLGKTTTENNCCKLELKCTPPPRNRPTVIKYIYSYYGLFCAIFAFYLLANYYINDSLNILIWLTAVHYLLPPFQKAIPYLLVSCSCCLSVQKFRWQGVDKCGPVFLCNKIKSVHSINEIILEALKSI